MTATKAFLIVLSWGFAFGVLGGAIGATLGAVLPDYYRSVFRNGNSPDFNPFQVGIGLGVTQGLAAGVTIAFVVLLVFAWRDYRMSQVDTSQNDRFIHVQAERPWARLALWGLGTSLAIAVFSSTAFVCGGIVGQQQMYQSWTEEKLAKIETILETAEFPDVRAEFSSAAQVYLTGTVKDDASLESLREKLVLAFGSEEAEEVIWRVKTAASQFEDDQSSHLAPPR